jgi:midasin (ATPase involved in ribosome maturation)
MPIIVDKQAFYNSALKVTGGFHQITRQQVIDAANAIGMNYPQWFVNNPANKVSRNLYLIPAQVQATEPMTIQSNPVETKEDTISMNENDVEDTNSLTAVNMALAAVKIEQNAESFIPSKVNGYVPFGNFSDVRSIVKSGKFYPIYITGLSGNGKTMMVEQVCAAEKREMMRVNITIETDEDDLIGGFRLIDGRTVWQNGPVIQAMERGAILLLDEVDLGSNKLMCLQPVLEGKPIYLKKINKIISPVAGFNIIATANTKGKGSDDGRFIGTNVMNEAFLERFSITMEQEYPAIKIEARILKNVLSASGIEAQDFVNILVQWAEVVRKSFLDGAVSEIISTRRLVHICEAYAIFGQNRAKAIELCLNRFDADTKTSFMDLYKKLDETMNPLKTQATTTTPAELKEEIQF